MKNRAAAFVRQIIDALAEMAKAKTMELKRKTRAFKTRLIIFSLLQNRKMVMGSISHKLKGLMGHHQAHPCKKLKREEREAAKAMVVVCNLNAMSREYEIEEEEEEEEEEDKYPDLRHSMFEEMEDGGGSVIELVKHSKEDKGEEFRLENEIDRVADLFIQRFHRQMWMQRQLSLSPNQPMLHSPS